MREALRLNRPNGTIILATFVDSGLKEVAPTKLNNEFVAQISKFYGSLLQKGIS